MDAVGVNFGIGHSNLHVFVMFLMMLMVVVFCYECGGCHVVVSVELVVVVRWGCGGGGSGCDSCSGGSRQW